MWGDTRSVQLKMSEENVTGRVRGVSAGHRSDHE